jgi:hypothetical protein
MVDVRLFGPGERIVFEPYTREMYEWTYRWTQQLNVFEEEERLGQQRYEEAVVV